MPKPRGLKPGIVAILLFASLNIVTLAGPAPAGAAGRPVAGDGDDKTNPAAAHAADSTKGGSKTAAGDASGAANSSGANAALINELQQLKDTVQAQAHRLIEHGKQWPGINANPKRQNH